MRRVFLIAGLVLVALLLAGFGTAISLARSVRSRVRARLRRARITTAQSLSLERSVAR